MSAGGSSSRRDLTARLNDESAFITAIATDLQKALEALSATAKLGRLAGEATKAISATIELATGVSVTVGVGSAGRRTVLEDRLKDALLRVGQAAAKSGAGVAFLYDEAHVLYDRDKEEQFPLSALLGAFVQVQDYEDDDLPVMLGVGGLPSLVANLQAARSHSERLFKVEVLDNLSLGLGEDGISPAATALVKAVGTQSPIQFDPDVAERVASDVSGYPYFIQWYGEALWDAADETGEQLVTHDLYDGSRTAIQDGLDTEFFIGRYEEANRAEQTTLRVSADLGGGELSRQDPSAGVQDAEAKRRTAEPHPARAEQPDLPCPPRRVRLHRTAVRGLPAQEAPAASRR